MDVLVTGTAGFIGAALTLRLLRRGDTVIGLDNHNSYYDQTLKEARLAQFADHANYTHLKVDLADRDKVKDIFARYRVQRVVHLAGQAGVRYSVENPLAYIDSNIAGFSNVLEGCRNNAVDHLVYASSSSVYGANTRLPYSINQNVDHPLSLYAATKKSNELMAHAYSNLFSLPTTGLRFFTVYGPWGRPDMALFKFASAILKNEPIKLFNYGNHLRDFTYIDDVVEAVIRVVDQPASKDLGWDSNDPTPSTSSSPYRIYNVGNSRPVALLDYVNALERALGRSAHKDLLPMQPGDVPDTHADVKEFFTQFNYLPDTPMQSGIEKFVAWYLDYYNVGNR